MSSQSKFLFTIILLISALAGVLTGCTGTPAPAATPESPAYVDQLVGAVIDPPRQLEEFNLESTRSDAFQLSDYRGEVILLYFGYRSCPDFCPTTFANMRRVMQDLGDQSGRVQVVFVTIDPERDTLDLLRLYTEAFDPAYIGLRGEGESLQAVMNQFGVVATKQPLGDSPLAYLMDHTATVFLITPDGRLQAQYLYGTDYRNIVHDVRLILEATPQT